MNGTQTSATGMPLRDYRVHRYVNAFCPHCHDEDPRRPLHEVPRLAGYLAERDGRVWLERGCARHSSSAAAQPCMGASRRSRTARGCAQPRRKRAVAPPRGR